jgi:hypothetical protein
LITEDNIKLFLPVVCKWAEAHEKLILASGTPLNEDQQIDAFLAGVKDPTKIKLLRTDQVPFPENPEIKEALIKTGFLNYQTIGLTLRHGIFIKEEHLNNRRLLVHEFAHVMQYERSGSLKNFLSQYLNEYLLYGYPFGPLETEAREIEKRICEEQ